MFDIDETNAPSEDFSTKVKGIDVLDLVQGGIGGNNNAAAIKLALRTAQLHLRLQQIESKMTVDGDSIINTLSDIVEAFNGIPEGNGKLLQMLTTISNSAGQRAMTNATNLGSSDVLAWQTKLNIGKKIVRSGMFTLPLIGSSTTTLFTILLPSTLIGFDPAIHSIVATLSMTDLGGTPQPLNLKVTPLVPSAGNISSFRVQVMNQSTINWNANIFKVNYLIVEN